MPRVRVNQGTICGGRRGNLLKKQLIAKKDYVINKEGFVELTRDFLLKRGECCHNGCKNCPYPDCWCKTVRKK